MMTLAATLFLGATLTAIAVVDAREMRVPDILSLPLIVAGLVYIAITAPGALFWHAGGAVAGYLLIWGLAAAFLTLRGRDGVGMGDAKLLAAGGAWAGLLALPAILLAASAAGLVWALALKILTQWRSDRPLPFGPFLASAIFLIWLVGAPGAPPVWR